MRWIKGEFLSSLFVLSFILLFRISGAVVQMVVGVAPIWVVMSLLETQCRGYSPRVSVKSSSCYTSFVILTWALVEGSILEPVYTLSLDLRWKGEFD
ncbi:hypothetical protein A2U01_0028696 [Trifolium medium]|uniref:Uncharacterized protein n=1 Tax=Trifolium medium TaxID=97028 RepID=A0A392P6I6_9FABA|nr:hypothetical protein [Trifolium medium]